MTEKTKKWNEAAVQTLMNTVGDVRPVSVELVTAAAEALGTSTRSIASKLRQLDIEVSSMATAKAPAFTPEQGEALAQFVNDNAGVYTYKEIADQFLGGAFTAKQVQGKLLALELTSKVKPAEKVEVARTYGEAEEATFISMANSNAFLEEIAEALGKSLASVRGKALSLTRSGQITKIPAQRESHKAATTDIVETLGDKIHSMTVEEIAEASDKTPRGIKTMLTRRGIKVANYDGESKREKAAAKTPVAA